MQINPCARHEMTGRTDKAAASSVIVRRGAQLMVVFAGCFCADEVRALRQADVKVGVALAQGELARVPCLEDFSYAFVSVSSFGRSPLQQALKDLATRNWVIDDDGADRETADPITSVRPKAPIRPGARLPLAA